LKPFRTAATIDELVMAAAKQTSMSSTARTAPPRSFAEAYRDHAAQVARWAARLGALDSDVEDVVQEVFLVVDRKWPSLRGDGNFTSWLFQITRTVVANQRRRLRWRRLWSGGEQLARARWEGPDPDADLQRRGTIVLFHRALERLPEKQRTVFVLYELDGMSTPAIAELVQRKLSTVKVQLARARERFVAAYERLLRRECDNQGIELSQLAQNVVAPNAQTANRFGKKTS
jgi:RNA polymerase sigma factor (sigma-70 family)